MITRIAAALVAALTIGSGPAAFAAAMDHDPTTGLSTYYYYGPISELSKKGLPMKDEAKKYTSSPQRATPQRATQKRGNSVLLLENRAPRPAMKHRQ
jgi:ABC-type sugar transport system substrate-binding protein